MTEKQQPSCQPSGSDDAAFRRRRNHSQIEAMTGLILQAVGFPSRRHRDFIAALQSVNSGEDARVPYTPFRRAHLTLAAHMQLQGSSDTKRKAVYRETVVLRAFTKRTGIVLFHVTPGKEDEATTYIDYLTPAADAAAQLALSSPLWQTDKQRAKQEAVAWAVEQLPKVDPEADDTEGAPPLPVDAYEAAQDARLCRSVENVADEVARRGGDDDLWLERHIKALVKIKASRKKTAPARNDHLSLRRLLDDERGESGSRVAADAGAEDGEASGNPAGDNSVRTPLATSQAPDTDGVRTLLSVPPAEETPASAEKEPDLGAAALSYARRGWHVFPLHSPDPKRGCTCSLGPDCKSPGKHPRTRRGLKDATADEAQIRMWWQRWPNANVGLATGRASGLVAVDVDHRAGGGAGSAKEEIAAELQGVNAARCIPPLDEAEVERIAASATRYQPGSSRARAHAEGVAP